MAGGTGGMAGGTGGMGGGGGVTPSGGVKFGSSGGGVGKLMMSPFTRPVRVTPTLPIQIGSNLTFMST